MKWQGRSLTWSWEKRQADYTQTLVQLLQAKSAASVEHDPLRSAALETAAGIWGRALSSAKVSPEPAAAVLTPPILAMIGRSLIRTGQVLFVVDVLDGRRVLTPASSWDVLGSASPASWRFKCELAGPDTTG